MDWEKILKQPSVAINNVPSDLYQELITVLNKLEQKGIIDDVSYRSYDGENYFVKWRSM